MVTYMHNRLTLAARVPAGWLFWILLGLGLPILQARTQAAPPGQSGAAAGRVSPAPLKQRPPQLPLAERLRAPDDAGRSLLDKLRSPRETLKTLYFAIGTYDLFPQMIDDAVACLDLDSLPHRPTAADAALLALQLDDLLQSLALSLSGVPDQETNDGFLLHDADGLKIALRRCPDGGWRFDDGTLGRLPAMCRTVREHSSRDTHASGLRPGFSDPRATLRQFLSDVAHGDFYAAARALDLSALGSEERRQQGPILAQQLAFVLQRCGYVFRQEVPDRPDGPPYTWHADRHGRIALERVRQPDGTDAWLFTRLTVRNLPKTYTAVQAMTPDPRYVRLGLVVPPLQASGEARAQQRPEDVPAHLGSPRALLQGFFRAMAAASSNEARLADALEFLDLSNVPAADRTAQGAKLAGKLEGVLRKLPVDLSAVPDDWNAPPRTLGEAQGVPVEIVRQRDGCWCFSAATVARLPEMFDKLAGTTRPEQGRGAHQDSARDTVLTFQSAARRGDLTTAAACLDLSEIPTSARAELGPVLAFKLKYVLDRIGRIYIEEIPDKPDGPRHLLYRGELGRVVLDRRTDSPQKGNWEFTAATVRNIEPMFRSVRGQSPDESLRDSPARVAQPSFWGTPGVWLRVTLPDWLEVAVGRLDLYQWLGLVLAALSAWAVPKVLLGGACRLVSWLPQKRTRAEGQGNQHGAHAPRSPLLPRPSSLTPRACLRPFTWLAAVWIFFMLLAGLDLPLAVAGTLFAAEKFLLAALFGWLGWRLLDLIMAFYTHTDLLLPHRNLSDMVVPVTLRLGKAAVLLLVATYVIYEVGEIELLGRFLTGLGIAGLAASLAAQDAMKSYFGTLLLIGERTFKIGDRIIVNGTEGIVEQVGFRSTRLRTAEDSLLTIPNAVIAAAPIDNMGARSQRRFSTSIVVPPETPFERLLEFRDRLQRWLSTHNLVARDKVDVHIHEVTNDGVELSLTLFLSAQTSVEETRFREALNCEILALAGSLGVNSAPIYRRPPAETIGLGSTAA
jgi:MscS family membrane protein